MGLNESAEECFVVLAWVRMKLKSKREKKQEEETKKTVVIVMNERVRVRVEGDIYIIDEDVRLGALLCCRYLKWLVLLKKKYEWPE